MGLLPVTLTALVGLVAGTATTTTDRSVPFDVLHGLGFSDNCVSFALDTCSAVQQQCKVSTLLKEAQGLLQETRDLLKDLGHTSNQTKTKPRHCKDLLDAGDEESGVRVIYPYPGEPERGLRVYCDQTTDLGGWTLFQRRMDSPIREDFYRIFREYREGFGNLEEEFWLGLDALHVLTSTQPQRLRIDLADWEGGHAYAKYGVFSVQNLAEKYRLRISQYSGTAGDSFANQNNQRFTTIDSDNDSDSSRNCAREYRGAWWYNACHHSNLNGYQYDKNPSEYAKGISWGQFRGASYSLRRTAMMIRPAP